MSSSENLKIPLQEIKDATNGFANENIIGEGGFGTVYQGHSKQHGMLAIKRLNPVRGQGEHEYGTEINLLSKYKHENIVSLVGICKECDEMILVYKYEANQSLDNVLHRKDLSWMRRLHICLGAARGLRYLHDETGSGHVVIHRDIKSSNILLDDNWNAKISDFGLSKIAITNSPDSVIFTMACGTNGYVDPQILHGGITQKSDVYSFGVVLYEVLFGKLVGDPDYGRFTVKMAKKHYEENTLHMMIDSDLRNEMNSISLSTFATIAYQCLEIRTEDRPTMSEVVEELEKALDYQQVGTSESFGLSSSGFVYDVYISFRVQEGYNRLFTSSLIEALEREGLSLYPYKDNSDKSVALTAIKQSRAFIIVFSETFATDSLKLEEVAEIVKCVKERGNVVLPIFGDVDPSEVREQNGTFGEAMSNPKMKVWKNALVEAAKVSGLESSNFKCCEDLIKKAVATIKGLLSEKGKEKITC